MNVEENRLQTFSDWPADAVVSPSRIAKAGFFSLNQDLMVQCFSCGLQICEWDYGDQVMARHRQLSPTCTFVIDPSTSGNVPNISLPPRQAENASAQPQDAVDSPPNSYSLMHEAVRLQSFENWPVPHIVSPENLARAGFYYLKQRDKTKCAFCEGVVVAWEFGDDPDREHKRHFPNCRFVQMVINPRLEHMESDEADDEISEDETNSRHSLTSNVNIISQTDLQELGINAHRGPKRPKYATLESRLRTFANWPEDLVQTPDILAQAGFYYDGSADQVRCFHCDGGLRHWDPQDDPWTEHAKWFPKCAYVLLVKGREFITACAVESDTSGTAEQQSQKCSRTVQRREVSDREIQAQMLTPQVMAALNVGLHVGRIKQAIKEKLEQTGTGFSTADAVIEATLNLQCDEEEISDSNISQEVTRILGDAIHQTLNQGGSDARPQTSELKPSVSNEPPEMAGRPKKVLSLEEENRLLKEERLCKICMDFEVGIVFLPCGHLATCVNCAPNLQDCPVCRCSIKATVRTFFS